MKQELMKTLEGLGYEVYEQGSFTDTEKYPEHFFTIWNHETEPNDFYDNTEQGCIWYFTINFYSVNPLIAVSQIIKAKEILNKKGWIVNGKGNDIYSDSKEHSGRSIEAIYIEK